MKIVYLSNFFNHHQKYLADELYSILGENNYYFIETVELPQEKRILGYEELTAPYLYKYNKSSQCSIDTIILEADAVIFGEAPISLIKKRSSQGKLILRDDERLYKSVSRYIKWPIYTYKSLFFNQGYLLCASAFGCRDYALSGMKTERCFKWGYFPETIEYNSISSIIAAKQFNDEQMHVDISILWVSRLIKWKHPEAAIELAEQLIHSGVNFVLSIIGAGPMEEWLKTQIEIRDLKQCIHFLGAMSPKEVRTHMEINDIFIFTSDRNEGWGAVLNESMNSACAVVASEKIGSVPYLIKDGKNGLVFKNKDWDDLCTKVKWLIDNPEERAAMGASAYDTITTIWNSKIAAHNLVQLIEAILYGKINRIVEGPCSHA